MRVLGRRRVMSLNGHDGERQVVDSGSLCLSLVGIMMATPGWQIQDNGNIFFRHARPSAGADRVDSVALRRRVDDDLIMVPVTASLVY
jgi:hypothetical protein